jgi:hypothetical protein
MLVSDRGAGELLVSDLHDSRRAKAATMSEKTERAFDRHFREYGKVVLW